MVGKTLETRVAVIESDIKQWTNLFGRLDVSIEKITELNISIKEVLAVHEQRITTTEVEVERNADGSDIKYEQLHSRISTINREILKNQEKLTVTLMESIDSVHQAVDLNEKHADDRIRSLEKRQWMMMGAAAVMGFIIGNAEVLKLFMN
jgi:chromosome segregation ATPase|tara:strand:+ start:1307 stop:1756 length:450 start_codon:yes stop_codon:yes gene_type:complete